MMTEAKRPAHSPLYFIPLIMEKSPSATGRSASEFTKRSERKYSFHIAMKLKIVTVLIPPLARGNTILQKVSMG